MTSRPITTCRNKVKVRPNLKSTAFQVTFG